MCVCVRLCPEISQIEITTMAHLTTMKQTIVTAIICIICLFGTILAEKRSFAIDYEANEFRKDGKVFRYVSGSFHYFQSPHELWRDRIQKMKFGGLNVLQTYIEWGMIETSPGVYDFSGNNNLTHFINIAQEEGLLVIIRVGPFIDAERDMGGLPPWLLKSGPVTLRTSDPIYLSAVDRWLKVILPLLRPLLYQNGGPVIMVQVENEYGSYKPFCASNGDYKAHMRDTFRQILGDEVVLFTTDGNADHYLKCGKIPNVFSTVDFGAAENIEDSFAALRRNQENGPLVNSEFYSGWLDYWENPHQTVKSELVCKALDKMLSMNASVNIYMYHGGTNFGFTAGSNDFGTFNPVPTSYDYDAPISEAGDLTPKFYAIKEVIRKYLPVTDSKTQFVSAKMQLPPTVMERKASIFDVLPTPILAPVPRSFEQLNHSYGFMLYSSNLTFQPTDPAILSIPDLHDRAQVFIDKEFVGTLSLTRKTLNVSVLAAKTSTIDILVENQGRLCFGNSINQSKGILSSVYVDHYPINSWNHYRLFDDWNLVISKLSSAAKWIQSQPAPRIPSFFKGNFTLPNKPDYPLDSFLQVTGWTKGVAFLNGFNLGRYWPVAGPQETLYAPSVYFRPYPLLNEIVLFELERSPCSAIPQPNDDKCSIQFVSKHIINGSIPFQYEKKL